MSLVSMCEMVTNENRYNYAGDARTSIKIKSFKKPYLKKLEGKKVSLTHKIRMNQKLTDPLFFSDSYKFFTIRRVVEIYTKKHRETKNGNAFNNNIWSDKVHSVLQGQKPRWSRYSKKIKFFKIGKFLINTKKISYTFDEIPITDTRYLSPGWQKKLIFNPKDKYFYPSDQNFSSPKLGDYRLQFRVRPAIKKGTIFGEFSKNTIVPGYEGDGRNIGKGGEDHIHHLFHLSKSNREQGIKEIDKELSGSVWRIRIISWFFLSLGIFFLFSLLFFFTRFIPFFGRNIASAIFVLSSCISVSIWLCIFFASYIFSTWWTALGFFSLIGWLFYRWLNKRKQKDIKKFSKSMKNHMAKSSPQHASFLQRYQVSAMSRLIAVSIA